MRALLWLALGCALSSAARANPAEDQEIAKAHFATGLSYYDTGRYRPAVNEFREAYRLVPRPELLYNIARAYEKVEDAGRATDYYLRYLAARPAATEKAEVTAALARLKHRVGWILIHGTVPDASLFIDGEPAGAYPAPPLAVTAGRHDVVMRRDGFIDATARVVVVGERTAEISLELRDSRALLATPPPPPRRKWLWFVAGAGVAAALVTAVVLGVELRGTDYAAAARSACHGGGCVLIDVSAAR